VRLNVLHVVVAGFALALAGCNCAVPKFPCENDRQCPDTYSCVASQCQPCPVCDTGERCAAGSCVPAPIDRLAFTTAPQTIAAGACSAELKVGIRDAFGATIVPTVDLSVTMGSNSTTLAFFRDSACTEAVVGMPLLAGTSEATIYARDTATGLRTLTASSPPLTDAAQTLSVTAGPPAALVFTTAPQTVTAGSCSAGVGLEVRDAAGNPSPVIASTPVTLDSLPATLSWFSDAACTTAQPVAAIAPGSASRLVYFLGAAPGMTTASASVAGLQPATQDQTITPAPASALAFASAAQTLAAGACSGLTTLETRDVFGTAVAVTADLTVALTAATATFYSDAACANAVTSVTVAATTSGASFYFRDNTAGARLLTASATSFAPGTQNQTITAGPPSKVVFTTNAQTLLASTCTSATVETRDALDNPTTAGATVDLTVGATAADLGATLYSDAACTAVAANVAIAAGSSSVTFYWRGRTGGTVTLDANVTGLTGTSQAQTVRSTVRTGTCTIAAGATTSANCTIAPALFTRDRTILFSGATVNQLNGEDANVRCVLTSTTTVTCDRSGTLGAVSLAWQTVEFPTGNAYPLVRHLTSSCNGTSTTVAVAPALNMLGDSFVLLSTTRNSGNGQTTNSARVARLSALNQVTVQLNSGNCNGDNYGLQVVEYPGAVVTTGSLTNVTAVGATLNLSPNIDQARTFVLASHRSDDASVCSRALRSTVSGVGQVAFARGAGNGTCTDNLDEVHFQRVQLPVGNVVQQPAVAMAAASLAQSATVTAVDPTRTAVFSGTQLCSGQAWGESANTSELFAEAVARHTLTDAATVTLNRAASGSAAAFSPFVVEFAP
jgi:hypothetical protein